MKPYIICHMITSLDGKITAHLDHSGTPFDKAIPGFNTYYDLEETIGGQAWMCGRSTFELFASKSDETLPTLINSEFPKVNIALKNYTGEYCIVVDTSGKLRWENNFVDDKYHIIYVITENTPLSFVQYLSNKNISYIKSGEHHIDFPFLFEQLYSKFSITKLRLEGGGKLNGSIYSQGLIDEISIVLSPLVVNNPCAPSVFEDKNSDFHNLSTQYSLSRVEKLEHDLLWLLYQKLH